MSTETEPVTERWTFGGIRVGTGGKRIHEWVTEDGTRLWYKASGSHMVGGVYEMRIVRSPDTVTRYGNPVYVGRSDDEALRESLSAKHRAAEVTLSVGARERADKKTDPLELAIERLAELAKEVPPSQRANFAAYVAYRVGKIW